MMSVGFADLPTGVEVTIAVSIPEGLDVVISIFGQLKGVGARSVGESDLGHFLPIFKGPNEHRAGHGPGVVHCPG